MPMKMDPARQYALKLRVLQPADRDWILAQLEPEIQERLRALIAELDDLGVHVDQNLLDTLLAHREPEPAETGIDSDSSSRNIRLLDSADPQWVANAMRGELPAVRSIVESSYPWSWLDAPASTALSGNVRADQMHHLGPSARVRSTLIALLAKRILEDERSGTIAVRAAPASVSVPQAPRNNRWFQWLR